MQGQDNFFWQRTRSVDLILNRLPTLGSRSLDVSVLLALVFFVANIVQYWNNWAVDLSAYYYAGYFYDTGQFDQIYAGPSQIIGPEMPAPWVAAVAQSGHSGEQTYPFIYLPWIAALMAPIARNFSPMQVMNAAAVLNAALMAASIFLAWRIMAPKRVELWLWTLISVSVLSTSAAAVLALSLGQVQILVFALCLLAFERYRAGAFWVAGAALAFAACIKITPAAFVLIFLWDRNWRALGGFAAVCAAFALYSLAIIGVPLNQQYIAIMSALNNQIFIAVLAYSVEGFAYQLWDLYQGTAPAHVINEYIYAKPQWIDILAKSLFVGGIIATWLCTRRLSAQTRMPRQLLALSILIPVSAPLGWVHYFLLTAYLLPGLLEHMERRLALALIGGFALILGVQTMVYLVFPGMRFMPTIFVCVPFLIALFGAILAFGVRAPHPAPRNLLKSAPAG